MMSGLNVLADVDYMAAEAWFGTKTMIRAAYEPDVCAMLRMKKGSTKHPVTTSGAERRRSDARQRFA